MELCLDPAGVSARDIANRWDVTEKSAWAMLNRIQDALVEPKVGDAALASNAPVWFELPSGQRSRMEQDRARRDRSAAEALEARRRIEDGAAERVQRAVERARFEAKSDREKSDVEGAFVATLGEPVTSTKAPITARSTPSEEKRDLPSGGGRKMAEEDRDSQSGVAAKGPSEAPEVPSVPERNEDEARTSSPTPAAIAKVRAARHSTADGAVVPPRTGMHRSVASANESTRKRQTRATSSGGTHPAEKPTDRSQVPVDNSPGSALTERVSSNVPDTRLTVKKTHEQVRPSVQRSDEQQRVREPVVSFDEGSLGGGWLGRPDDQSTTFEAPELGPAWISAPADVPNEKPDSREDGPGHVDPFVDDNQADGRD